MAKAKSKTKAKSKPRRRDPAGKADEGARGEPLVAAASLSSSELAFVQRVVRFLVHVLEPAYAAKAQREGYDQREHAVGWMLLRTAAGEARPFGHTIRERQAPQGADLDVERRQWLQEIDAFENKWFPRTRAIIRRVVPRDRRDAFVAAFFKDLTQQRLGPAVVGSVSTFVARLEDLERSADADAKAVRDMLRSRGLTETSLASIKALLHDAQVGTGTRPDHEGDAAVSAEQLEQACLAQREALADLRDWFFDWGTTLRTCFGAHDQARLGLIVPQARAVAGEVDDAGEGGEDSERGPDEAV